MAVDNEGLYYDTIEAFSAWISDNLAGILANDVPNDFTNTDTSKEVIKEALLNAEGEVDGALSQRGYAVPLDSTYIRSINVIKMYVRNIAVYELYGRRGITQERYYKYKLTMDNLSKYAKGDKHLPEKIPFENSEKLVLGNNMESTFSETSECSKNLI